jgi:hypothetical protein
MSSSSRLRCRGQLWSRSLAKEADYNPSHKYGPRKPRSPGKIQLAHATTSTVHTLAKLGVRCDSADFGSCSIRICWGGSMRLRPRQFLFSVLLLAVSLSSELNSQTTTSGGLTGVITDQSSAVVPSADVEIKDNAKGTTQSTKTDHEGVYRFFFLAPGRYTLTVAHGGFRKEGRVLNVLLGPPVTVNVKLEIAKASSEVTVTGEAPLIQAENGDVSTTMNQKQISEVPNPGNDLAYIAQTAPGAVMNTDTSSAAFSILGMPGFSYLRTIDGMNENDNYQNNYLGGRLFLTLGQNQIEEATVVSTGYSGQFGGAAGGNINYFTKSGGNEFHGNAQYYWNGRALNANNWFLNAAGEPRPSNIAHQWAASFGGPIKRDKLFFFLDTEGLRVLLPQVFFVTIPSPQFEAATLANIESESKLTSASVAFYKTIFNLYNAAPGASSASPGSFTDPLGCSGFSGPDGLGTTVPCSAHFTSTRSRPSYDTLTTGRVDWNAGKNDHASLRLQYEVGRQANYTDPISSLFDGDYSGPPWWQGRVIETHAFGSSAANQFLLAGSYGGNSGAFQLNHPSQALAMFAPTLNFVQGTFNSLGGGNSFMAFGFGAYETQYQISDDVVKSWRNHKFGFGANFVRIYWTELPFKVDVTGQLNVQTLDAFFHGGVDDASRGVNFTQLRQSFTSQSDKRISYLNSGIYGQDEWHARPNLTLTLALRSEHYSNPVCQGGCYSRLVAPFESLSRDPNTPYYQAILTNQKQAFQGIDNVLWSPRFSFAWQPLGLSHNSVIRGGIGIFYDPLPAGIFDSLSSNVPIYNLFAPQQNNLTPDENTSLFKDAAASNAAFLKGFASGQTLAQIQAAIPNFSLPAVSGAERTTHYPQYQRWSLEWQQAFGARTSVNIGYFGHHGIHELVQNTNANAYGFGSLPASLCASPPVAPCAAPRFSFVTEFQTNAVSTYNGMIVSLRHQWGQGLFQANYTYGHALDEVSNGGFLPFTNATFLTPQNPNNLRGAYGPADYDVRHSFNANYIWELPVKHLLRDHGWDSLLRGWQISGTIFARTGFPYTVFDPAESGNLAQNNYSGAVYAVPTRPLGSGPPCGEGAAFSLARSPCQIPQVMPDGATPNPNALFIQAGCETGFNNGSLGPSGICDGPSVTFAQGRNHFRGPSYFDTDFTIMKKTKIHGWEKATLGVGLQFFNFFNHPNFGFPDAAISDSMFGQISYLEQPPTSILGTGFSGGNASARMVQLKVQLQF